jgi:preprotein translocase SecF subunit
MPFELIPSGTNFDFIGKRYLCFALSIGFLLAGAVAIPLRGVRLGIDFAGGTEVQVRFSQGVPVEEGAIRKVVDACGIADASVVRYGELGESDYLIRFRAGAASEQPAESPDCPLSAEDVQHLADEAKAAAESKEASNVQVQRLKLALKNRIGPLEIQRVEFVGARVGSDLRRAALYSIAVASLLILVYIGFRFNTRFAPGAVIALLHDMGITAGIFVIMGWQFDLTVLAALLTIMGYSLNDTVIIYDRIRENMALHTKFDLIEVLNHSVNQTLSRTILTVGTTFLSCMSLLIVGGPVVRPFAIAMTIGIVVGTFSSIYVAAPLLLYLFASPGCARWPDGLRSPAARCARASRAG